MLCALSVFVIVSVLFVVFIAAICLPDCAMDPGTQPTELEVLGGRVAVLESEKHSAEQEIQDLRAQLFAVDLDRATLRMELFIMDQDYGKVVTRMAEVKKEAMRISGVLRQVLGRRAERITVAVSGDKPPPAAADVPSEPSLPTKRRRSD